MALRFAQCNCGSGALATEKRNVTVRVQGQPEQRTIPYCKSCAALMDSEAQAEIPFTREYHIRKVNHVASRLRSLIADWYEEGDSDMKQTKRISNEMLLCTRTLSADLAAISALDDKARNRHLP